MFNENINQNNVSFPRDSRPSANRTAADNRRSALNESKFTERESLFPKRNILHFKVILLGDIAVGKTAILNRYVDNKYFQEYRCNVGVEFKVKSITIDDKTVADLKIWDTCGEEKFRTVTRQYYRDAHGIIVVFDLTCRETFDKLTLWIQDIADYASQDVSIVLIGNKNDLTEERKVSPTEANSFAATKNIPYFEVSAKTGNNVVLLFESLTKLLVIKEQENRKKKKTLKEKMETDNVIQQNVTLENSEDSIVKLETKKNSKCC